MKLKKITFIVLLFFVIREVKSYCSTSTASLGNNKVKTIMNLIHTTVNIATTLIPYGSCKKISRISRIYGSRREANGILSTFSFEFSDVKEIKIYSGKNINSFTVTFSNGNNYTVGNFSNSSNSDAKTSNIVNLENEEIIAIVIHEFFNINGIVILLHNPINDTYSWTNSMGSFHGNGNLI
jgi:hypothetical protein